jgi:hypothetical protein
MREATDPFVPDVPDASRSPAGAGDPALAPVPPASPVPSAALWTPWALALQTACLLLITVAMGYQLLSAAVLGSRPWPVAISPTQTAVRLTLLLFVPAVILVRGSVLLSRVPMWWRDGRGAERLWIAAAIVATMWVLGRGTNFLLGPAPASGAGLTRTVGLALAGSAVVTLAGIVRLARVR